METYYVGAIPDDQWRRLLRYFLDEAEEFAVHVPDGAGPLSYGRTVFLDLPGVVVRPWDGMAGAVEIRGEMSAEVRQIFTRLESSLRSFDPERKLWDYRLLRGARPTLSIGDYHDLLVTVTGHDLERLRTLGVDTGVWASD